MPNWFWYLVFISNSSKSSPPPKVSYGGQVLKREDFMAKYQNQFATSILQNDN
ncbi:MAG: hypothetical protein PVH88_23540 [Ignavibacteria bacterium]|jgi:hypothetical protein